MAKDVIIALDFPGESEVMSFLDLFDGEKPYVKIGMELYYALGPSVISEIKKRGHKIFLDLKLHDIPNTVKSAMAVLSRLDVDMTNLHASGGSKMMEAAIEGLTRPDGSRPLLIAVTQLTSTSQKMLEEDLLIREPMESVVSHYAKRAAACGLDGVVCSPLEAGDVKAAGSSLRGRSVPRSGAGDYSRESEGDRLGLHRGRTPDNARGRSRCTVPPRGCGIFRINGYTKTG